MTTQDDSAIETTKILTFSFKVEKFAYALVPFISTD